MHNDLPVCDRTTCYACDPQGTVAARLYSAQAQVSSDHYAGYGMLLAGGPGIWMPAMAAGHTREGGRTQRPVPFSLLPSSLSLQG
jgi:hypothetical protein